MDTVTVATPSSLAAVAEVEILAIHALEKVQRHFAIYCHTMPPEVIVDGLLGLDFFRNGRLTIDFRSGLIDLD